MTTAEALAVACIGLVAYSYVGYPVLLGVVSAMLSRFRRSETSRQVELPDVAVVIAAFNEEKHIAARIQNLRTLDYPLDKLTIWVGDDGSTDRTAEILRSLAQDRLHVWTAPRNRGKAAVLNELLARIEQPIVVFTDANTFFRCDALRSLVAPFAESRTGAVCGELCIHSIPGDNPDSLYWRIEQRLKQREASMGALLGANGGIYAIRRELWKPLALDTICDDFTIAMSVAAAGFRVAYQPGAQADEAAPAHVIDEFHRRVRIGIGNFQALIRRPEFLVGTNWSTRFAYVSHKVLRWVGPHLLLAGLIASAWAATGDPLWRVISGLQLAGYAVCGLSFLWARTARHEAKSLPRILRPATFLFALNLAFLIASFKFILGRYGASWQRTTR